MLITQLSHIKNSLEALISLITTDLELTFDANITEALLALKWWDLPEKELVALKPYFEKGSDGVLAIINDMIERQQKKLISLSE